MPPLRAARPSSAAYDNLVDPAPAPRGVGWMQAIVPGRAPAAPSLLAWLSAPALSGGDRETALVRPVDLALVWDRRMGRLARQGRWWPAVSPAGARSDETGSADGFTGRWSGWGPSDELGWSVGGGTGVDRQRAADAAGTEAPFVADSLTFASGLVGASVWYTHRLGDRHLAATEAGSWVQILDPATAALAGLVRARYLGLGLRFASTARLATGIDCQLGAREAPTGEMRPDGRLEMSTRIRF